MKSKLVASLSPSASNPNFKGRSMQPERIQEKKKVFIIDDEPVIVNVLGRILQAIDRLEIPKLDKTTSISEARALVEKIKPDIIISDKQFDLTNRNAHLELLAYVRENHPEAKVVLCSSFINDNDGASGYDGIITKPPNPDKLVSIVEKLADAYVATQKKETKSFLMIDHEKMIIKAVERILESVEGLKVLDCQPVNTTAEAMERIREQKPDIVLVPADFQSEVKVGEKLLEQIRKEFPEMIVALHAPYSYGSVVGQKAHPYDAIIDKPGSNSEIKKIIEKLAHD